MTRQPLAAGRRRVIIESPFAGDRRRNVAYAQAALLDSLMRGEAPIASHLLHTQVLDDNDPLQRAAGIEAGLAWAPAADAVVLYVDLGQSNGMIAARERADAIGLKLEWRQIGAWTGYNPVHSVGGVFPTDRAELVAYLRSLGPKEFENLVLAVRHA